MHEGSVTIIIIVVILLIGILSYYIYDYYKYKAVVDDDFKKANKRVDVEKSQRLGNVKSVVDQVNVAHDGIHDEFSKVQDNLKTINNGIQTMASFNDVGADGKSKQINLKDLPSALNPDISLLTHVTSLGGFTIKDLDSTAGAPSKLRMCSKEDPTKCIKIPDENGNVYLTNLYKDSAIALDGSTIINAPLSFTDAGKLGARISGNEDGTGFMETNAFGIGASKATPNASLHIMADKKSPISPFKITVNSSDILNVDQNGTLHTTRIELRPAGTTNTTAILQAVSDGIMLDAPNVYTSGNLLVNGMLYQSSSSATETQRLLAASATPATVPTAPPTTVPTAPPTTVPTTAPSTTVPTAPPTTVPTTTPTDTPTVAPASSANTVSTFISGPIQTSKSTYTKKPVDYMNQPYMIKVW